MTWFLLFVMNSVVVLGAVLFLVRRIERRIQPTVILEQIRAEIDELMVEFNQTTERNVVLIEERIHRLNKLLEEADRRASVLRRDIDAHQGPVRAYERPTVTPAPERGTRDVSARKPVAPEVSQETATDGTSAPSHGSMVGTGDKRAQIIDLHDKGIAPNIIAARLGTTVGEVELIVSLTRRKR